MSKLYNLLGRGLLQLFGLLPLRLTRALAACVEWLLRQFTNDMHSIARNNLAHVKSELPPEQLTALVNSAVRHTLACAFEMPAIWRHDNRWLNQHISRVVNEDLIRQAVTNDRGVLVIAPHVGNWEVLGRKLVEYGPTTSLYQPPKQAMMESLVRQGREKSGAKLVPTSQRGIALLLKALRNHEIIGILPDQVPKSGGGEYAPFLGFPAYTMTLVYNLIQKTQCRVVLAYALREPGGFSVYFKAVDDAIYSADKDHSVAALNRTVERCLEEDFAQYQWTYKRYKYQPDNKNIYAKP